MYAALTATALRARKIQVRRVVEGDSRLDGEVMITELISVQVATNGSYYGVTHQVSEDEFVCYPLTRSLDKLVAQIREALGLIPAKAA